MTQLAVCPLCENGIYEAAGICPRCHGTGYLADVTQDELTRILQKAASEGPDALRKALEAAKAGYIPREMLPDE